MILIAKPVIRIDPVTEEAVEYSSVTQTKKYGFDKTAVWRCATGKRFQHKEFVWIFKEDLDRISEDNSNEHTKTTESRISP